MELRAMLTALNIMAVSFFAGVRPRVVIYSDSMYAINVTSRWARKWARNGWVTKDGKRVSNQDLVMDIHGVYSRINPPQPELVHVRGHKGIAGNELADHHANKARLEKLAVSPDQGKIGG
jgi:ribonuclease HI